MFFLFSVFIAMNSKTTLQEHFQKAVLPLPVYDSVCLGGPAHQPVWKSTVKLHDGRTFEGEACGSKREAEKKAASVALSAVVK